MVQGYFTRALLSQRVGLSDSEVDSCERAGAMEPTIPGRRRSFTPAQYSPVDAALAAAVAQAHTLGMRGQALVRLWSSLSSIRPMLSEGFTGRVLVTHSGQAHLVPAAGAAQALAPWLAHYGDTTGFMLLGLEVTSCPETMAEPPVAPPVAPRPPSVTRRRHAQAEQLDLLPAERAS